VDHIHARVQGGFDVALDDSRQPTDRRIAVGSDVGDSLELGVGVNGEPSLDDVDASLV
jgi:hypothetical protein